MAAMAQPARIYPIPSSSETTVDRAELFRHGSRIVYMPQDDGSIAWREIPLSAKDFLNPEEGDMMVQGNWHDWVLSALKDMLKRWLERSPDVTVFSDFKMLWGIPDLPEPAPDVCVVRGLRDRRRYRGSLDLEAEGVRPCLLIEVVSPTYRRQDYDAKVKIYERVGIDEYLIVEPRAGEPFVLTGYRLDDAGRYRPIDADANGRLLSESTGLWFRPHPEPDFDSERFVVVEDAATGERLLTAEEEARRRREAEAEVARLKKELARRER